MSRAIIELLKPDMRDRDVLSGRHVSDVTLHGSFTNYLHEFVFTLVTLAN